MVKGKVSVIIPNYNYAHFIEETMQSVVNQTYENWEMIVVDDNSTDNSREVIENFIKNNPEYDIRLIHNKTGPSGTPTPINIGIKNMSGEYFAWLSSDDVFMPTKLEEQVEILDKNKKVGLVYTSFFKIDEKSIVFGEHFINDIPHKELFLEIFEKNQINGNTILVRKDVFDKTGLYIESLADFPSFWYVSEYLKYLEVLMYYEIKGIKKILHKGRIHPENRVYNNSGLGETLLIVARKFFLKNNSLREILKNLNVSDNEKTAFVVNLWEISKKNSIGRLIYNQCTTIPEIKKEIEVLEDIMSAEDVFVSLVLNGKTEYAIEQKKIIDRLINNYNKKIIVAYAETGLLEILNKAKELVKKKLWQEADNLLEFVIKDSRTPEYLNKSAYYYYALVLLKTDRNKEGKDMLEKLIKMEPHHIMARKLLRELN